MIRFNVGVFEFSTAKNQIGKGRDKWSNNERNDKISQEQDEKKFIFSKKN